MFQAVSKIFVLIILLLSPTVAARQAPADVSAELSEARKARGEGDQLSGRILDAARDGITEIGAMLDQRDAAYDRASEYFGKALDKDAQNPQANFEFGRYWLARGDFYIARRYLENAWLSDFEPEQKADDTKPKSPVDPISFIERAGARAEKSFTENEKADLLRTLGGVCERAGERSNALACYRVAYERNPKDPRNRLSFAIALYAGGNMADTEILLKPWDDAQTLNGKAAPDFPADRPNILSHGLYTLGLAKEQLGYQDDTLRLYHQAEELAKKTPENREIAENARLAVIRLEDRIDESDDKEKDYQRQLAKVKEYNERITKEDSDKPAERRRPLRREPNDERKQMREALGLYDIAMNFKKQAMRDPVLIEEFGKLRINAIKAADLERLPEYAAYKSAEQTLQEAIMKYARHARLHYELAMAETLLHRFSAARTLLDAAALYNPNDIATLNLRGSVLLELGQWDEAAGVFRRLLALDGDNGMAHFGLARALAALKSNEFVCEASLDAFSRASRLGVRDDRMNVSRALRTKDGQIFTGVIIPGDKDYVVKEEYAAPFRIAKDLVAEVIVGPGLRDQVAKVLEDYRNGIAPAAVKRVTGRKRTMEDDAPRSLRPDGTIFSQ